MYRILNGLLHAIWRTVRGTQERARRVDERNHCVLCGAPARYVIVTTILDPEKPVLHRSAREVFFICEHHHPNPAKKLTTPDHRPGEVVRWLEERNLTYNLIGDWIAGMHHST